MSEWSAARTIVPPVDDFDAPDPHDAPEAVVVRLRRAGLVVDGEEVEVVTDAPPPVRQRFPPGRRVKG